MVKHLGVLREAGLVHGERAGREILFHADTAPLTDVEAWIGDVNARWSRRLDRLAAVTRRRSRS